MKNSKRFMSLLLAFAIILTLAACGNKSNSSNTDNSDENSEEVVIIGTEGTYPPYNYINDEGNVDGYDVAVALAVAELVPEIEFKFEPTAWDSIFVALESGNFDLIVNQIAKNESREEKYQFAEVPYAYSVNSIIYKASRTDIQSIKDLHGKTVAAGIGTNNTTWLEEYNAEHDNAITIEYYDGNISLMLQDVISGRVDATVNNPATAKLIAEEQGLDLESVVVTEIGIEPVYFLYSKNDNGTRYKELIDTALQTLTQNGTLSKLSIEYLGADYTSEEAFNITK